jgi:hypothetical protein
MGTFDGSAIWRNKMCAAENFVEGYVSMSNLKPPNCQELIASTFVGEPISAPTSTTGDGNHQMGWFVMCIYCRLLKISERELGCPAILPLPASSAGWNLCSVASRE